MKKLTSAIAILAISAMTYGADIFDAYAFMNHTETFKPNTATTTRRWASDRYVTTYGYGKLAITVTDYSRAVSGGTIANKWTSSESDQKRIAKAISISTARSQGLKGESDLIVIRGWLSYRTGLSVNSAQVLSDALSLQQVLYTLNEQVPAEDIQLLQYHISEAKRIADKWLMRTVSEALEEADKEAK